MSTPTHPWYIHGLVHWLSGVAFAVILGLLIVVVGPHVPGFGGFLHNVEQRGVDYAMRLQVRLRAVDAHDNYVFLDVDAPYCDRIVKSPSCEWRSPAKPEVVASAAEAALQADPAELIVDAPLWGADAANPPPPGTFEALAAAIASHPKTHVLAASPFRPTGATAAGATDFSGLPPALRTPSIEFAPAWVWSSAADTDAVVRDYPLLINDVVLGQPEQSLAFRAAHDVDPRVDVGACQGLASGRLLFTLPSLVPVQANQPAAMEGKFLFHYDRYLASLAIQPNGGVIAQNFAGKIVVIGSSAPVAIDMHESPLGRMAGPEININAIKAFVDCQHGFIAEPPAAGRAWREAEMIGVTSIPFLLFWLGYFGLAAAWRHRRVSALLPLAGAAGFTLAIIGAMILAVVVTLAQFSEGSEEGFSLEFFTPLFALSLEGFAEGARWTIDRIETRVENAIVRLTGLLAVRGRRERKS